LVLCGMLVPCLGVDVLIATRLVSCEPEAESI